ncbi:MAG TPA: diacylglycerol kinase family protein [Vicinamibacteria bacterium]|nr:diacylglycerol kinase family protein [Vicinamibacteria bacterium]
MRVLVLRNPRAGTSTRTAESAELVTSLKGEGASVEEHSPCSGEDTKRLAAGALRFDVVIACGGDGTLNDVVNGLVQIPRPMRPALAVVPVGRGNDFAAEIGIRDRTDTWNALRADKRRLVDLGRCGGRVFLGIAGAGFDAEAARRARETVLLSGRLLYTYAVLRTLVGFRPIPAKVYHDGGVFQGDITFAAVGNSSRYGGGMRITPQADLSDGMLDLCLVRAISPASLLRVFPSVFEGRHLAHPKVDYVKTRFVEIETERPAEVFADGEPLSQTPVKIEIAPKELEVYALC